MQQKIQLRKKYLNLRKKKYFNIDKSFFLRDGLHLNRKGYELIINKLNKLLSNDN